MHDLACVVHLHSTHSDGTGTVPQIARAAGRAGADVVLLTDHDTLEARRRGEEGWHGDVLVLVGEEVSPPDENHYLAFDLAQEVDHRGLSAAEICSAVERAGGFGFAAHPFHVGSPRFRRARGMPWRDLDFPGLRGIELWSFVNDAGDRVESLRDAASFLARPGAFLDHPPRRALAEWDRMTRERRVVAIGGVDAHQFGVRIAGRVPLRLMGYHRSFRHLRTHVLVEHEPTREADADRESVYGALREGRCYLAMDSLASATGFRFWAEHGRASLVMGAEDSSGGAWELHARVPRPAELRLVRDGEVLVTTSGSGLHHHAEEPGVYRVEARLERGGRDRTWIVSNPIYLR